MRRALVLFAVVLPLLACGGIWQDAKKQASAEQFMEQKALLDDVQDGPNKEAVDALLDRALDDASRGVFGIVELAEFRSTFDEAVADGEISDAEAAMLQEKYEAIARD